MSRQISSRGVLILPSEKIISCSKLKTEQGRLFQFTSERNEGVQILAHYNSAKPNAVGRCSSRHSPSLTASLIPCRNVPALVFVFVCLFFVSWDLGTELADYVPFLTASCRAPLHKAYCKHIPTPITMFSENVFFFPALLPGKH